MLASTIFDECRFLTATDTTTYPDADLLRGLNILQAQAIAFRSSLTSSALGLES